MSPLHYRSERSRCQDVHCDKRSSDAGPSDTIWFDERRPYLDLYLKQDE
jgi:hypothetical protein